jgi:hypothetical protein
LLLQPLLWHLNLAHITVSVRVDITILPFLSLFIIGNKQNHTLACVLQVVCRAAPGDNLPVNLDDLGDNAATVRNYAFASFWFQLPLTIVSACILIFAVLYSKGVSARCAEG